MQITQEVFVAYKWVKRLGMTLRTRPTFALRLKSPCGLRSKSAKSWP